MLWFTVRSIQRFISVKTFVSHRIVFLPFSICQLCGMSQLLPDWWAMKGSYLFGSESMRLIERVFHSFVSFIMILITFNHLVPDPSLAALDGFCHWHPLHVLERFVGAWRSWDEFSNANEAIGIKRLTRHLCLSRVLCPLGQCSSFCGPLLVQLGFLLFLTILS